MSLHAEMSPLAAAKRADRILNVYTPPATKRQRAALIREQLEKNKNFFTDEMKRRFEEQAEDLEREAEEEEKKNPK